MKLDSTNFYDSISDGKVLVKFEATWCGPCKAIKPFITYLHENYPNVEFLEIDIEDDTRNTIVSNSFIFYKTDVNYKI